MTAAGNKNNSTVHIFIRCRTKVRDLITVLQTRERERDNRAYTENIKLLCGSKYTYSKQIHDKYVKSFFHVNGSFKTNLHSVKTSELQFL